MTVHRMSDEQQPETAPAEGTEFGAIAAILGGGAALTVSSTVVGGGGLATAMAIAGIGLIVIGATMFGMELRKRNS